MADRCVHDAYELVTIIVNSGRGTGILSAARRCGATGGTILLGRGTVKGGILRFLELYDEQKELVYIIAGRMTAFALLERLDREYRFAKPHHGIAFCTPIGCVYGSKNCQAGICKESEGEFIAMHNAIYVIVDKGNAENVIDAATRAGSTGGTIINARGSGIHETSTFLSMEIEPEKEIVLIIADSAKTEAIASSIHAAMELDKPGNGIMFIQDVAKIYGLREA